MIFPSADNYISRRSPISGENGIVASSQVLASRAGTTVLELGGNAADAAVATAAALQVTQACSTGLGGDVFVLYYESSTRTVHALNGSGRSPKALDIDTAKTAVGSDGRFPLFHAHTVTVPGAPAAWVDFHERFGVLSMTEVLAPAVELARKGFPMGLLTSGWWGRGYERQLAHRRFGGELAGAQGKPVPGETLRLPTLADSLETLAREGKKPFYEGRIAQAIIRELEYEGGVMTFEDLAGHQSEWVEPISVGFNGYSLWECPPNGQGLAALVAASVYQRMPVLSGPDARLHRMIEAMRIGFADAAAWVCDPDFAKIPIEDLLSVEYATARASEIGFAVRDDVVPGPQPWVPGKDTVYLSVVDAQGNGASFINSNYMGFGTGIVPEGCGYSLQNRGHGFVFDENHPNRYEPGKRPYHTIIPGMITDSAGGLFAVYGVMGGMMQPQGHLQVAISLIEDGVDPQSALDRSRFQLVDGDPNGVVMVEVGFPMEILAGLSDRGHCLKIVAGRKRAGFGLGQAIVWDGNRWWAGTDSRGDGAALSAITGD